MVIDYVFACLPVRDRDAAMIWYERLLGRPATFVPNEIEAVWQLAQTASLYILQDGDRAGGGVVTLAVGNLEAQRSEIAARGIGIGVIEDIPGAGRKAQVSDPDGNAISLVEILSAP